MKLDDLIRRLDEQLSFAHQAIARCRPPAQGHTPRLQAQDFARVRASGLSFIEMVFGREHSYYKEFDLKVKDVSDYYTRNALGILASIREELGGGWLTTTRGIISGEVFADFMEMADHLLSESYKDAAAVLVGGVLEEQLRQLCSKTGIAVDEVKNGKTVPRKADTLNSDLAKAGTYGKLDQKSVVAWLDIRNKAAHARYSEYTDQQVQLMSQGVRNFLTRHPL